MFLDVRGYTSRAASDPTREAFEELNARTRIVGSDPGTRSRRGR